MRLGELLLATGEITAEGLSEALARQARDGGRIGDNLVAVGAIGRDVLDEFLLRIPGEPKNIAATGIGESYLLDLMTKLMRTMGLETASQISDAIKLPMHIVNDLMRMGVEHRRLRSLGQRNAEVAYALTEEGVREAQDALQRCGYVGPAPVALEAFVALVKQQKVSGGGVTVERIRSAFAGLSVAEHFVEKIGPALNSGRAILMYGPPGNGKTLYAQRFANIFRDMIYVPFAILVDGQVIKVFDGNLHTPIESPGTEDFSQRSLLRPEESDRRWVACQRPFVMTGGELTLEMLDLQYDAKTHIYDAPLHVKALGGCFMVDDFGRQLVPPRALLNRWIVPMESRVDFLKLHTGKSFELPFEELLIFSTNLEPEDLMDPAFLRRLPYKIEAAAPDVNTFREIFDNVAVEKDLKLTDEIFNTIVRKITEEKRLELACYQPAFIVDQVVAACRFLEQPLQFEPRFIDYAVDNLRVHRQEKPG